MREAIETVRVSRPFRIDGWVLQPDHLRAGGDTSTQPHYRPAWRTAKGCGTLWQHCYWEHLLRDERDFRHHLDYLHFNPVKHGLVEGADWPWLSFQLRVQASCYPLAWNGSRNPAGWVIEPS